MITYKCTVPAMTGNDFIIELEADNEGAAKRAALINAKEQLGFVKRGNISVEEISSELQVIEAKSLNELMVLPEAIPDDFYSNPMYSEQIESAIKASTGLVYPLDTEGEKRMKSDCTAINKYATSLDKIAAAIFKSETDLTAKNRSWTKDKVSSLKLNRENAQKQFEEEQNKRLNEIHNLLRERLQQARNELAIQPGYYGVADLNGMVKLSGTLTGSGKLTTKAVGFIKTIANSELAEQNRIEGRKLIIENRSLKEGINPPLSHEYFGTVLYASDEFFNEKLDALVEIEHQRRIETEQRIADENELANQRKIDEALAAQKREIAQAQAQAQAQAITPSKGIATPQSVDNEIAKLRKTEFDRKHPDVSPPAKTGKKIMSIYAEFQMIIGESIADEALKAHFEKQLPEKLKATLVETRVRRHD